MSKFRDLDSRVVTFVSCLIHSGFLFSFKRGLYLAQAVQVAYCLGLVVAVAICVRERIWMRESRNSMVRSSAFKSMKIF